MISALDIVPVINDHTECAAIGRCWQDGEPCPALSLPDGARRQYNGDGEVIIAPTTCGTCGRTWDDAVMTSLTPVPSGRCPFEYEHDEG